MAGEREQVDECWLICVGGRWEVEFRECGGRLKNSLLLGFCAPPTFF